MGPKVHRGGVVPKEKRLIRFDLLLHPTESPCRDLLIDGFHALLGKGAGVFDGLLAYPSPAGVDGWVIFVTGEAVQHASRAKRRLELGIFGIVRQFWLFFGIQVIEIAKELVESMHSRQKLIPIAEMVLAELAGCIAKRFEQFGDGRVLRLKSDRGARHADFGQTGTERVLAADESRASGSTALLAIEVGKGNTLVGDAVGGRRFVAHHAPAEVADIPSADVIAPKDQDIGLFCS